MNNMYITITVERFGYVLYKAVALYREKLGESIEDDDPRTQLMSDAISEAIFGEIAHQFNKESNDT